MTKGQDVSRRSFIGGAAGVGAMSAALAVLGLEGLTRAEGEGGGTTSDTGGDTFGALALPPIVAPGVRIGVVNLADTLALTFGGPTSHQYNNGGVFVTGGWIDAALDLPVGARLVRVDVFSRTFTVAAAVSVTLNVTMVGGTNSIVAPMPIASTLGNGQASYTPGPLRTVALGERFYVEAFCNLAEKVFLGAIYQYYDANPQLNLLPVPIRVYDSRAGATPTTVVKGRLANNATRVIDCTFGGAVPAGAAAAMVTLTTVGTVGAGFMALWQNGLPYPETSSITWDHNGTNVAVTTVVTLDTTAKLMALTGPGASTDFIIDVIGFYA